MTKLFSYVFYFFLLFHLFACNNLKYLKEGEKLYLGSEVKLLPTEITNQKKLLKKEAEKMVRPNANSKILGLRVKLWLYNIAGTPKGKGLRYWLKNKIGEPPVLFSSVEPERISKRIDGNLFNHGDFKAITSSEIIEKNKSAKVIYSVSVHDPYRIDTVFWPVAEDELTTAIAQSAKKTLLKRNDVYDLEILNAERVRIDKQIKQSGFYYFNPEYLEFKVDTTLNSRKLNLHVSIKDETPYEALLVYRINNIYVTSDYNLGDTSTAVKDTISYNGIFYTYTNQNYRPKTLSRAIFLQKNDIYSVKKHDMTLNRLMGIGTFKFVNIRYTDKDSLAPGYLDTQILLTPLPRKSARVELELQSKSNNFAGPHLTISYRNRNALHGAEALIVNLHGSVESQINGRYKGLFSYELGPEVELQIPRFIVPFHIHNSNSYYIPKTSIKVGYDYLKRVQYFNLNSFNFSFGYHWKEDIRKEHQLNPLFVNYVKLRNQSEIFVQLLNENPFLKRSFEEQFIAGLSYSFLYSEQMLEAKKNQYYFNSTIEFAGNTISLVDKLTGKQSIEGEPKQFLGAVYSQYARADVDLREYTTTGKKSLLAFRLYGGVGVPYGNSNALPYIKQFFSGGVSSIRAFRARTVGPGKYEGSDNPDRYFFGQGGDIKLEANAEFRFPMISILKGALFVDAGNIWLSKDNPSLPGGKFRTSTFYKELAIGAGYGFRFDLNFFVLRFDLAFPIRKPWLESDQRWVISDINFGNPDWRKNNLILNIAIGYPF